MKNESTPFFNQITYNYDVIGEICPNIWVIVRPRKDNICIAHLSPRYNLYSTVTQKILLSYDFNGGILSILKHLDLFLVEDHNRFGIFSISKQSLIVPIEFGKIFFLSDSDDAFIVQQQSDYQHFGLYSDGQYILENIWHSINYQGDGQFNLIRYAGGNTFRATFSLKARELIYVNKF